MAANARAKHDHDHLFKLVLIGDSGVGKSCLLLRFADNAFNETYVSTIGVDFRFRTIQVEGKTVKLQIWDTAGQERFRTITSAYYRGADGIILVFDVTSENSYEHMADWLSEVSRYSSGQKLMVGNKSDRVHDRAVKRETAQAYASSLNIPYMETSAKNNDNIEETFTAIASALVKARQASTGQGSQDSSAVKLNNEENDKKDGCC
mmetsp:Transcript_21754/g.31566  ORF Transcript_21754/g.31566 Transcript_21754/m.31566 type:complete len:206 (-) Transcript_21754:389-1006(-)